MSSKTATEHKIVTLEDIVNCTNESNVDNFLSDLKKYLQIVHSARVFVNKSDCKVISKKSFTWVDDDSELVTINMHWKDADSNPVRTKSVDKQIRELYENLLILKKQPLISKNIKEIQKTQQQIDNLQILKTNKWNKKFS